MDPNEALELLRAAMVDFHAATDGDVLLKASMRMAFAAEALDDWLSLGGFLPADWGR